MKWKKFLKGFLWKIEAGEKKLKGFPFKFTPWLVLHVLHFIVDFFYNPRASLARAEFKRDFLDNHGGRRSIAFKTFFDPRYRPPTPVLVDSEVRGTTLQKLIVDSEVRGTTPPS